MISLDFDWQTNEFMLYCRTTQLSEKSMMAYEQSLRLFERWCMEEMNVLTVDSIPKAEKKEGNSSEIIQNTCIPSGLYV